MKKILIVILSIIITFNLIIPTQTSEAAVVSKVASQTAKKIAKEVIKDAAINTAINLAVDYIMPSEELTIYTTLDAGFAAVCLPKDNGKKDEKCSKPAQIKNVTTADKNMIADKAEEILERKVGTTGWLKFLDWFVPIFLAEGAFTWLKTTLDPDAKNLFDEVALETLIELDIIKTLPRDYSLDTDVTQKHENGVATLTDSSKSVEVDFSNSGKTFSTINIENINSSVVNAGLVIDLAHARHQVSDNVFSSFAISENLQYNFSASSGSTNVNHRNIYLLGSNYMRESYYGDEWNYSSFISYNGLTSTRTFSSMTEFEFSYYDDERKAKAEYVNSVIKNLKRVVIEFATITPKGYQTSIHYIDKYNRSIVHGIDFYAFRDGAPALSRFKIDLGHADTSGIDFKASVKFYEDIRTANIQDYTPHLKDILILPTDLSRYFLDKTTVTLPSPGIVPIKTPDGTLVKPDGNGGWINAKDGTPINVDEDALIIEDPKRTKNDDGFENPISKDNPLKDPGKETEPTGPTGPTEPNNPSCNESDDMEVHSGQCEGVPYLGSKLEFIFGNATGNKNHIDRSLAMELQLNSIGIFDDAKGKKLVLDNLSNAFDDPSNIVKTQDNGRVVRGTMITGPNGKLKVESVWNKEKLISVKLGEDVEDPEDPEDIENSEDIEDSREYTNDGTDNDETLDNGGVLDSANFAQKTYNPNKFSDEGIKYYSSIAGRPIKNVDDLVDALRNGEIKPSQVPIDYIEREGNTLILNTRSSIALTQAGIPRNQWNAVNRTGNEMYEQLLTDQLVRNKLTSSGTPTVRPSGAK